MLTFIMRYRRTYPRKTEERNFKTVCCQFEIIYFSLSIALQCAFLPVFIIREINYLFYIYTFNSFLRYTLSFMYNVRMKVALFSPYSEVRKQRVWLFIRWFMLLFIILSPRYGSKYVYLTCNYHIYPVQFMLVFFLDFISALVDFMGWLLNDNSTRALKKRKRQLKEQVNRTKRKAWPKTRLPISQ